MGGFLPQLNAASSKTQTISAFAGYNHNARIKDNEFDDMANMSSSFYPVLAPRSRRGVLTQLNKPNGLAAKSNLFWIDGTTLYHNGVAVSGLTLEDNEKQLVSMGAYLLIWPDKKYYNTYDQTYGNLEASITIAGSVSCTLTKADGTAYATPTVSGTAPDDPADGDLWMDTTETLHLLKQWSESSSMWIQIATTYIKIAAENIGALFCQYDGVTISGLAADTLNGDFILQAVDTDYIVITGILDGVISQEGGVTVKRSVPDMDFVCEFENRVWGCSSANHEVYASKLGDPKNWHVFMNLSTDSYAATIGSDGDFTCAVAHLSGVEFWKEDRLHRVTGTQPGNFSVGNLACRGVEKGSERSVAIVNERLYYKSRSGICVFDGYLPSGISESLGNVRYHYAVAGTHGSKYYISMADDAGDYHLFVYDTVQGVWHKEDDTQAIYFAEHEGELFYIDASTKELKSVGGRLSVHEGGVVYDAENSCTEDAVSWMFETGDIGLDLPSHKYVSRILIRMQIETAQEINVDFMYDSSGVWVETLALAFVAMRTVEIPIIPRRCDHMRMRVSGTGDFKVYSITKNIEETEH